MKDEYKKHVFEDMLYCRTRGDSEIWFVRLEYESILDDYHSSLTQPFNQELQ